MVSRKHFFGLGFALMGLLGSKALGAPPRKSLLRSGDGIGFRNWQAEAFLTGTHQAALAGEPLGGVEAQTECKAVICASICGLNPPPSGQTLHWHGPLDGYCYFSDEDATRYQKAGILSAFGLENCPSPSPGKSCYRLGLVARMASLPHVKSYYERYKEHGYYEINAEAVGKWDVAFRATRYDNKEQATLACQDTAVGGLKC